MIKRKNITPVGIGKDPKNDIKKVHKEIRDNKEFSHKQPKNMKKALNWIKDTLAGDNKAGELVHGALDVLPIPNQAIAKLAKALLSGEVDKAKAELPNIFTTRNIVALVASVAYFAGWVTLEDLRSFIQVVSEWI